MYSYRCIHSIKLPCLLNSKARRKNVSTNINNVGNLIFQKSVDNIIDAASTGNLKNIDLRVSDITKDDIHPDLAPDLTAANFGKVSELASKNDIALGILNMIFETVGMQAIFAARGYGIRDIVLTGNMAIIPQAHEIFSSLNTLFDVNFIIPPRAQFSTVIGSALIGAEEK